MIKVQIPGTPDQLHSDASGRPCSGRDRPFVQADARRAAGDRISTPPPSNEEDLSNNVLLVPMDVVRDRLRVLLVAGAPTWDVRYIRRLLKEDPGVDLSEFFHPANARRQQLRA